jgi:hypothetical protein
MSRRAEEMSEETRVSLIGLDTSHAVTFSQKMHDPDCPEEQKVKGMKVTACLRFIEDSLYKPAFRIRREWPADSSSFPFFPCFPLLGRWNRFFHHPSQLRIEMLMPRPGALRRLLALSA